MLQIREPFHSFEGEREAVVDGLVEAVGEGQKWSFFAGVLVDINEEDKQQYPIIHATCCQDGKDYKDWQVLLSEKAGQPANLELCFGLQPGALDEKVDGGQGNSEGAHQSSVQQIQPDQRIDYYIDKKIDNKDLFDEFDEDVDCGQFLFLGYGWDTNLAMVILSTHMQKSRQAISIGLAGPLQRKDVAILQYWYCSTTSLVPLERWQPHVGKISSRAIMVTLSAAYNLNPRGILKNQFLRSVSESLRDCIFLILATLIINLIQRDWMAERVFRTKTCLSSFQRYCSENERSLSQMSRLQHYFQTTITRYKKKHFGVRESREGKNAFVSSSPPKSGSSVGRRNKNASIVYVDPELIEISKVKLHSGKCERVKTEYMVHRNNIKAYIKMKKSTEFMPNKTDYSSSWLAEKYGQPPEKRWKPPYRQLTNSTELEEVIVTLRKNSTIKKKANNFVNGLFQDQEEKRESFKKSKVVFSSKGNTSTNFPRKKGIDLREVHTSKNKDMLTGWEADSNDEDLPQPEVESVRRIALRTIK